LSAATLPFATRPIDEGARDGRYQLVFASDGYFAIVRFRAGRWEFSSGRPLDFEPTEYRPQG
jgi:hypothetical protein